MGCAVTPVRGSRSGLASGRFDPHPGVPKTEPLPPRPHYGKSRSNFHNNSLRRIPDRSSGKKSSGCKVRAGRSVLPGEESERRAGLVGWHEAAPGRSEVRGSPETRMSEWKMASRQMIGSALYLAEGLWSPGAISDLPIRSQQNRDLSGPAPVGLMPPVKPARDRRAAIGRVFGPGRAGGDAASGGASSQAEVRRSLVLPSPTGLAQEGHWSG